jgi:hypothetical protein
MGMHAFATADASVTRIIPRCIRTGAAWRWGFLDKDAAVANRHRPTATGRRLWIPVIDGSIVMHPS